MTIPEVPRARRGRQAPRRSRARLLVPLLMLAWVVLEIWLLVLVADATSPLVVVLLLVAGVVVGAGVVRRAGTRAWRGFAQAFERVAPPGAGPAGAAAGGPEHPEAPARPSGAGMSMLGGALLALPGFASDVLGLLFLFPPTRALLRRALPKSPTGGPSGPLGNIYEQARMHRPDGKVVPGEVVDHDRPGSGGGTAGGGDAPRDTPGRRNPWNGGRG